MKHIWYILFSVVFCNLLACNVNKQLALNIVAEEMTGNWVNQNYLDILMTTKSPNKAYHAALIHQLYIQKDTFSKPLQLVLSFQEGDDWILSRDKEGLYFESIYDSELVLRVKMVGSKKMQLGEEIFVKKTSIGDYNEEDNYSIEKELFVGKYSWKGKLVSFEMNGAIQGMEEEGVNLFHPIVDYYNKLSIDKLWLGVENESSKFGFRFSGNSLFIYELTCPNNDAHCPEKIELGNLIYELNGQ